MTNPRREETLAQSESLSLLARDGIRYPLFKSRTPVRLELSAQVCNLQTSNSISTQNNKGQK